jgi:hypothetical protein
MPKTREELINMTPEELIKLAKNDIDVAWMIFNNTELLHKLGYSVKDNRMLEKPSFWKKVPSKNIFEFSGYLCKFLLLHKEIYEVAKNRMDILERLSAYQEEAIKDHFKPKCSKH